jgi:hypothetical protein
MIRVPSLLLGVGVGAGLMFAYGLWLSDTFGGAGGYAPSRADSQLVQQWRADHDARRRLEGDNAAWRLRCWGWQTRAVDAEAEAAELRGLLLGLDADRDGRRREATRTRPEPAGAELIPATALPTRP